MTNIDHPGEDDNPKTVGFERSGGLCMSKPDAQMLDNIGRLWVQGWSGSNPDAFADLFSEDGEYMDPAFGVLRRGRDFMKLHHQIWHRAISEFRTTSERIITGADVVVVEAICQGKRTSVGEE